jgi:oligopeptide/dipeptide ABC transporter ATP-binding protein
MPEGSLMELLLQVRDLAVGYWSDGGRTSVAVDDLSFDIAAGEAVGLLGESGCGKTTLGLTLLRLLPRAGYVRSGSVTFMGIDLQALCERELQKIRGAWISMVYQEPGVALNPVIRVGDQIAEVLRAHRPLSLARAKEEVKALLTQVGFAADSGISEAYPHQLSGGQKQRVVIAQAIACHPALIIADEPTSALDAVTQIEILTLLKTLQAKLRMALLLISHDPGELEQVVDRVLVMYAGRLVEEGPTNQVMRSPLHPYSRGLLQARMSSVPAENHKQLLPVIPGEPPDLAGLPSGCAFEPRCPDGKSLCRTLKPQEFRTEASRRVACFNYAH